MTTVTIVPDSHGPTSPSYRAVAGTRQAVGKTPGAALDAVTEQIDPTEAGTLVVVQHLQPDRLFTAEQQ